MLIAYSPYGNGHSVWPFGKIFKRSVPLDKMTEKPDAILLWGGTDIHPSYYNETAHPTNQAGTIPSERDKFEWKAMMWAKANKVPIIGVCRGAQFINAFAGGKLVQHCNGHHRDHLVTCEDGEIFAVTSSHHQMLRLEGTDGKLLAWSREPLSAFYVNGDNEEVKVDREPEIVFYPSIKALAIQGHPEWAKETSRFTTKVFEYINEYILGVKQNASAESLV